MADDPIPLLALDALTPGDHSRLTKLARELSCPEEFLGGPCLVIGETYRHPASGLLLRVTSGQYLSGGRVSNWWTWQYLDAAGEPTGDEDKGYGWAGHPIQA